MKRPERSGLLRCRWRLAAVAIVCQLFLPMPSAADDCCAPAQAKLMVQHLGVVSASPPAKEAAR